MSDPQPTPPAGPGPAKAAAAFLLRAARRQWKYALLPVMFGAAVTAAVAFALGRQTWESTGVMLYTPVPVPEHQKGLATQPDLQTLVSLTKSPGVLDGLRDEFDLTVPTAALDKTITVTAPRTVQTVTVTVRWAEPGQAARIANRLMERFIDQVRDQRRRKAGEHFADYEARLADCDGRLARANDKYHQFLLTRNVLDARSEAETVRHEVDSLLQSRATVRQSETVVKAQRERLAAELKSAKKQADEEAEKAKEFDASQDTVSEARRRQDRLKELIDEEKKRDGLIAELTAKRKLFAAAVELRDRGAGAPADVDVLAADIERLNKQLTDSEQVRKWKDELEKIDKVVVPSGKAPPAGSPIIQQTLARQLDLDLQLVGAQKELHELDVGLSAARRRLAELQQLLAQSEGFQKDLDGLAAERLQLAEQVGLFRRLRDQQAGEFSVVSPAVPAPYPASSTRKLYLLGGLALTGLVALARVCRREWAAGYHGGRRLAARAAVPVLAALTPDAESDRRAATEFRRWLPDYGAVVLVADARLGPDRPADAPPGLADVLGFRAAGWEPLLNPGLAAGTDWLAAGRAADPDLLASHVMRGLLDAARKRYSVVLVVGPGPDRPDTLDVLIPYAGGVVVCLGPGRPPAAAGRVTAALRDRCGGRARALLFADRTSAA